jgi:hypothetical protein
MAAPGLSQLLFTFTFRHLASDKFCISPHQHDDAIDRVAMLRAPAPVRQLSAALAMGDRVHG